MVYQKAGLTSVMLASALYVVGCGGSDNNNNNNNVEAGDNSGMTSMPVNGGGGTNEGAGTDSTGMLNGTWVSDCDSGEVTTATFSGNAVTAVEREYLDVDCTQPDPEGTLLETQASVSFPQGSVSTSVGTAYFINVTPEGYSVNGVPFTAEEIQSFGDFGSFDTDYSIYAIANDGRLYFGDDPDNFDVGSSPATRPTEVDQTYGFTRQ